MKLDRSWARKIGMLTTDNVLRDSVWSVVCHERHARHWSGQCVQAPSDHVHDNITISWLLGMGHTICSHFIIA
jgi:hypothetical protein